MWKEVLENPQALAIFELEPSLQGVVLSRLLFDYNGPTVTMTIQLKEYPAKPPSKWSLHNYNAVSLELRAMGVEHIRLSGWNTENLVVNHATAKCPDSGPCQCW